MVIKGPFLSHEKSVAAALATGAGCLKFQGPGLRLRLRLFKNVWCIDFKKINKSFKKFFYREQQLKIFQLAFNLLDINIRIQMFCSHLADDLRSLR